MKRGLKQVGEFGAPPGCWRGQCHKRGGARRLLKGRVAMEGGGGPPRICQKERERERRIKMSLCGCDREGEGGDFNSSDRGSHSSLIHAWRFLAK